MTVATNLTNPDRESNHEIINTILFGLIGLHVAAVLFIIYMIYSYTIALEKRPVYTVPI